MTPQTPACLSISEFNQRVSQLLERHIPLLWVQGEISNLTRAASGHWYFSLKDERATVRAVMFRSKVQALNWQPKEGDKVQAHVLASFYAPRGDFQLTVESLRPSGMGALYEQFLQHKSQLAAQGLFDAIHKKALPRFVQHIGVITSPQAAALRDVIHALARRAPHIQIWLFPTLVQGVQAKSQITQAIAAANRCDAPLAALLLIRGGGSLEDLWAFNEPEVAQAIFASRLPIISGVGHETDTTIADFVADVRAATPTAAAELISATTQTDWHNILQQQQNTLHHRLQSRLHNLMQNVDHWQWRLLTPSQLHSRKIEHLRHLQQRLTHAQQQQSQHQHSRYERQYWRWQQNTPDTSRHAQNLLHIRHQLQHAWQQHYAHNAQQLQHGQDSLRQLNPQCVLERGFAYIQNQAGQIIQDATQLNAGDGIAVQLARGRVVATVNHTE